MHHLCKPGLKSVNKANQRRINLVPFIITIPEAERDNELGAKLKAEWPGILAWAIQGCVAWQQQGLAPPKAVTNATQDYFEEEDAIARWIDARCTKSPQAWTAQDNLFASWSSWGMDNGEYVGSSRSFGDALAAHGFRQLRRNVGPGFTGLELKPASESSQQSSTGRPTNKSNETIKKKVFVPRQTELALRIESANAEQAWVPRSQIVKIEELGSAVVEIELPLWRAKQDGIDKWQPVEPPANDEDVPF